jgi:hypothetical protein
VNAVVVRMGEAPSIVIPTVRVISYYGLSIVNLCYGYSVFNQSVKIKCWHKRGERLLKMCTAVIVNINNLPTCL